MPMDLSIGFKGTDQPKANVYLLERVWSRVHWLAGVKTGELPSQGTQARPRDASIAALLCSLTAILMGPEPLTND